jgi:hypothetical protein
MGRKIKQLIDLKISNRLDYPNLIIDSDRFRIIKGEALVLCVCFLTNSQGF